MALLPAGSLAPSAGSATASKSKTTEFFGVGAILQAFGVLLCIWPFPYGLIPGIALLFYGSKRATVFRCVNCGNKVEKETRICPHCQSRF